MDDKRYQVFVSSTYDDLKEERQEVIYALLDLDCIPCGMEYFPATSQTQWDYIKEMIDDSDYYIVIIGGRYGSVDENQISFTEREYEYALSKGIPTIGFVHGSPSSIPIGKTDRDNSKQEKLDAFIKKVKLLPCKNWNTPTELGSAVTRSMRKVIRGISRVGWVRADSLSSRDAEKEIITLYKRIEELESKQKEVVKVQYNYEDLAQGNDNLTIKITASSVTNRDQKIELVVTWNDIIKSVFPKVITPIKENFFRRYLSDSFKYIYEVKLGNNKDMHFNFSIHDESYHAIFLQLQTLNLIEAYSEKITPQNSQTLTSMVRLTERGNHEMLKLSAILRNSN